MLSPFQVVNAPPTLSIAIVSVIVWVAVTVWVIEPVVKDGATDWDLAGKAISNNSNRYLILIHND